MSIIVPATWGSPVGAFYEEVNSVGNVSFAWPALPAGAKALYELTQAPAGSAAVASSLGAIEDVDSPGCYVLVRRVRSMGVSDDVARDVGIVFWPSAGNSDLTAPTPPAQGNAQSVGTTSVSLSFTHPGAPAGTTYVLTVVDASTGNTITPSSGTGLGPYVVPVSDGLRALYYMTATGSDGQVARSIPRWIEVLSAVAGGWTQIGLINFIGATAQTFTTTGDKTVTLADASTVTVNVSMSVGTVTTGTAGADAVRGLIADVPGAVANTAYRLRVAVPVSPSIGSTQDLMVLIRWRANIATGTGQRALVGLTTSTGSEASAEFSGGVLQNTATNAVKWQCRKGSTVADVAASVDTGWRDATTRIQTDVRVVGKARTLFATATGRLPDSGVATYTADIGADSSGPNAGLEAPLFSGSTVYVQLYSWNGGASGGACATAIERITVYSRSTSRVP